MLFFGVFHLEGDEVTVSNYLQWRGRVKIGGVSVVHSVLRRHSMGLNSKTKVMHLRAPQS
jgi:hypothetical protein